MKTNKVIENLAPNKIPDSPLLTAEIKDTELKLQGWVVIHSLGSRGSCGGVRLYPDVTKQEVQLLAKAMTYKYCFYEMQLGGAKAAITLPFDIAPSNRTALLTKFGEHLAPLIKARIYWPWTDMNCSSSDISNIYQGAGVKLHNALDNSAYFTALSTFASLTAAAEYYGIPPNQCKITIEGLGNVGKYLSIEIDRWGAKLIGASTRIAAAVNFKGLPIKDILKAIDKFGDSWVKENKNWDTIPKEQLFSLPMNVHIPSARVHSINETIAENLSCEIIVPAANVPCTHTAELTLNKKNITLLPDYVVNSGGVIGPRLSQLGSSDDQIRNLFLVDFKEMINRLLKLSQIKQLTPAVLASIESQKNFRNLCLSSREKTRNKGIFKTLKRRVHIPKKLTLKKQLSRISHILNERFA